MTDAPDSRNIHQRLAGAMAELEKIPKTKKKPGMQYDYVSHDQVTAATRPALLKHGIISYISELKAQQNGNRTEVYIEMTFANVDDPSDVIVTPSIGYGVDSQDKGPGKAITYACKIATLKTLGLETGEKTSPIEDVDETQDASADHNPNIRPEPGDVPLGHARGDGPSRHASHAPWEALRNAMLRNDNYPDLRQWWVLNQHERERLNSENQHFLFIEYMQRAFEVVASRAEASKLLADHIAELDALKARSSTAYDSLAETYNETIKRRNLKREQV